MNTPKKSQDPTEAALSAIEEALQVSLGDQQSAATGPVPPTTVVQRPSPPRMPAAAPVEPIETAEDLAPRAPARRTLRPPRRAANDDRPSIGQIVASLNSRPPSSPYFAAGLLSAVWLVVGTYLAYANMSAELAGTTRFTDIFALPYFLPYLSGVVLPIVGFFALAAFIRRTQEIRQIARAMSEVTVRLAEPEGISTDAVVSVGQAIRREVAALGDGIERAIARAAELESMVKNEVGTLERAYDENEIRVRGLVEELQAERDAIVTHGNRLREAMSSAHDAFSLDIDSVTERINNSITDVTDRVTGEIISRSDAARMQISAAGDLIIDTLTQKGRESTDRMTQVGVEIARAISAKGDAVGDALSTHLVALEEAIIKRGAEMADRFAEESQSLGNRITDSLAGFDSTLKVHGSNIVDQITFTATTLTDNTDQALTGFDDRMSKKTKEVTENIEARMGRIETALDERTQKLNETLGARTLEFARTIAEGTRSTTDAVDKTVAGMADYFAARAREIANTIAERAEAIDNTLGQRAVEVANAMANKVTGIEQTISDRAISLEHTLNERALNLQQTLTERATNLEQTIDQRTKQISDTLTARAEGVDQALGKRAQEVAATLLERTNAIEQALGQRALELTASLDSNVTRFDDTVGNKLTAIVESIEARGTQVTDALAAKIERVTEVLRNDTAQIERSLGSLAEEVSRALLERTKEITLARESLRSDVSGVLKQLEQANIQLQVVLEGVTGNLGTMETTLAERLTSLQSSIEGTVNTTRTVIDWAGGQVTDLREISSGVLRDLSTLTLRFENQGKFIAGIAEALGETHGRIDQTLADRRTAIEEIVALLGRLSGDLEGKLAGRANELGERLAAFNQLLQEALGQAETRARETANLVAETTTTATQAITNQYELIRGAYSEERGRTAIALKSTYQEAVEEMGGLFHEMNERFAVAARELRDMAEEVQRSLELTREELKRGVLELPEETRESAAAMRRVVADQIKALSELNDIVARHGRRVDLSEARRGASSTFRGGGGGGEEPTAPIRAPQAAPVQELPRPAPRTAPREEEEEFEEEVAVATEPRRAPAREQQAQPREQNGERSGWLGDLLSRASGRDTEGQRRTPLQTIESLDSLSSDVARMIDHDAATELWDRYKRGERNVVGRRLYTAHGQKTFDEIRRRYRRSAEFRDTVDRYIEEFERLLDQVARDDRGQGLTRTYLTSDTGKVYTLLAHAAGRLE